MEPSYAVKRRNGYQSEGRRPALRAGLRPQLELWLGLAWSWVSLLRSTPMKMEQIVSSETSALKAQTPGDYPENTIRHSTHGESLKSRLTFTFFIYTFVYGNSVIHSQLGPEKGDIKGGISPRKKCDVD